MQVWSLFCIYRYIIDTYFIYIYYLLYMILYYTLLYDFTLYTMYTLVLQIRALAAKKSPKQPAFFVDF